MSKRAPSSVSSKASHDPVDASPSEREPQPTPHATAKLRRADIMALLERDRDESGTMRAVSEEDIDRYERREVRDTIPAPADEPAEVDERTAR